MRIIIESIDHKDQRYPTTGDWQTEEYVEGSPQVFVTVSRMGDWRYEALVGIHEAIEAALCKHAGIDGEDVDAFDKEFEAAREAHEPVRQHCETRELFTFRGKQYDIGAEPGDDPEAPYYYQHQMATGVERILAAELGVSWNDYEAANLALYEGGPV